MSHIQFTDELVREYLLFRGFGGALKAFDADIKVDKDKGFRVDKSVDMLLQYIYNYDLTGLREAWNHLDTRLFTRLEQHFAPSIRKLESAVLKFYLVNASENNKQDKIVEFFSKLTTELVGQSEWKDWFVLPYIKNPEEHPVFAVYFTRQWQDTLLVSLHNFLAAVYQSMPQPTLSSFEDNAAKISSLQKENDMMRRGLANLISGDDKPVELSLSDGLDNIVDDFYHISQEVKTNENQAKTLKTLMRTIGSMPASPKLNTKPDQNLRDNHRKHSIKKVTTGKRSLSIDARSTQIKNRERDSSLDLSMARSRLTKKESNAEKKQEGNFLFLSQDEYNEHKSQVTTIKFNNRGNMAASADLEGNIKIWSVTPTCKTIVSFSTKRPVLCLDWVPTHERYIVCGFSNGTVGLYDTKESKLMWEINVDPDNADARVEDIVCSPADSNIIAVVSGKLLLIDLRTRKIEKNLNVQCQAISSRLNHNGQLAVVGAKDGSVVVVDLRKNDVIDRWSSLEDSVVQVELTSDYTLCYALSEDNKICCKSLNQAGNKSVIMTIPGEIKHPVPHGKLFCLDNSGMFLLTVGINSGVIYKIGDGTLTKSLELGGHKTLVTCVDWSFANQCATCATASQDGKIKISTLLVEAV